MARTTININTPLMQEIKKCSLNEGKKLSSIMEEILQLGLQIKKHKIKGKKKSFHWHTKKMKAKIDLMDGDLIYSVLDKSSKK